MQKTNKNFDNKNKQTEKQTTRAHNKFSFHLQPPLSEMQNLQIVITDQKYKLIKKKFPNRFETVK